MSDKLVLHITCQGVYIWLIIVYSLLIVLYSLLCQSLNVSGCSGGAHPNNDVFGLLSGQQNVFSRSSAKGTDQASSWIIVDAIGKTKVANILPAIKITAA